MGSVGVYLHVPFCERVCPYCDFAVVAARTLPAQTEARYASALEGELRQRGPVFAGLPLASIYFGGGTPSLLQPDTLARLIAAVRQRLPAGAAEPEITLEVNPSTVERARLPGFRAAGVNRLSIGVQSFDDATLKRLGRAHRAGESHATLAAAREAGFDNLSVDLIYGVPGQDLARLEADLVALTAAAPEHCSAYGLTIEAGTPYQLAVERGQLALPDEELLVAMMDRVHERLEAAGLRQYELSSYARPGREAVHNRRYWERLPVLGLGMGAWSVDPAGPDAPRGLRRVNERGLGPYLEAVEEGRSPGAGPPEVLAPATARGEAAFLALRTREGLSAADFAREFGQLPAQFWGAEIAALREAGLLEVSAQGDLRLTRAGQRLSDTVFARLVE